MKIIITEDQYNKFINLQRRLSDIMYEASLMIDNGDDFYWRVDFCRNFPTLKKYVDDVVSEIINQYKKNGTLILLLQFWKNFLLK